MMGDRPPDDETFAEARADTRAKGAVVRPRPTEVYSGRQSKPIYLRQRFHGELGQLLRDYYADALDRPLPPKLIGLLDCLRHKERSR